MFPGFINSCRLWPSPTYMCVKLHRMNRELWTIVWIEHRDGEDSMEWRGRWARLIHWMNKGQEEIVWKVEETALPILQSDLTMGLMPLFHHCAVCLEDVWCHRGKYKERYHLVVNFTRKILPCSKLWKKDTTLWLTVEERYYLVVNCRWKILPCGEL